MASTPLSSCVTWRGHCCGGARRPVRGRRPARASSCLSRPRTLLATRGTLPGSGLDVYCGSYRFFCGDQRGLLPRPVTSGRRWRPGRTGRPPVTPRQPHGDEHLARCPLPRHAWQPSPGGWPDRQPSLPGGHAHRLDRRRPVTGCPESPDQRGSGNREMPTGPRFGEADSCERTAGSAGARCTSLMCGQPRARKKPGWVASPACRPPVRSGVASRCRRGAGAARSALTP